MQSDAGLFTAFNSLSNARVYSMGVPCALQISELLALCELVGIVKHRQRVKYLSVLQELDQLWLENWASESKKKS